MKGGKTERAQACVLLRTGQQPQLTVPFSLQKPHVVMWRSGTDVPYFSHLGARWVWKLNTSLLVLFVTEPHCVAQADSISRELGFQVCLHHTCLRPVV